MKDEKKITENNIENAEVTNGELEETLIEISDALSEISESGREKLFAIITGFAAGYKQAQAERKEA